MYSIVYYLFVLIYGIFHRLLVLGDGSMMRWNQIGNNNKRMTINENEGSILRAGGILLLFLFGFFPKVYGSK